MRCAPVWLRMMAALIYCAAHCAVTLAPSAHAQTLDKADALSQINRTRILNGVSPLAPNAVLEKAAQRHSQDMADKGFLDHIGSDSSKLDDRVLAAGYSSWIGQRVWAELVYAGNSDGVRGGFAEALEFWASDDAERRILLDPRFREIGIGVALNTSPAGVTTAYWTLVLGAQPNALPVFINDGAAVTNMPQVAVRLAQEDVAPEGEGNAIGRAIEVRISADPGFSGAVWQKWEALLPFTFDNTPGLKTIYVQYRDASDRMTVSTASIQYDPNSAPVVVAIGPGAQTGAENTTDVATEAGAETDTARADAGAPANEQPAPLTAAPAPEPATDSPAAGQSGGVAVPTVLNSEPPSPATQTESARTPSASTDLPAAADPLLTDASPGAASRPDATLPDWLLPAVATAQAMVIVLGLVALLRRKQI